jgi:hypothetical protein
MIFGKKNLPNIKEVFGFPLQLISEAFLIQKKIQRDVIIKIDTSPFTVLLFLSHFDKIWSFPNRFYKNIQISVFMKILPVEAKLRADGQTDGHDKPNTRFSQFYEHV